VCASRPRSLLVVTPCSARKRYRLPDEPLFEDLVNAQRRSEAFGRFGDLALAAREMYTGQHHRFVLRTVDQLRHAWSGTPIDIVIVSAGFGLVEEHERIIPYSATFAGLPPPVAMERAQRLQIGPVLGRRLADYEAAVLLLSGTYLAVLEPPLRAAGLEVYFAPPAFQLAGDGVLHIRAGVTESRALGVAPRAVRAALFERFVKVALADGWSAALESARSPSRLVAPLERPIQLALCTS